MSLYTTQFQGPDMAVAGEQSCLKLTFVSLVIDPAVYCLSPAVRQWIGAIRALDFLFGKFVYVIAWVGVKFGINTMSIVVRMVKLHEAKPSAIYHSHYNTSGIYPKFHSHPCYHKLIPYTQSAFKQRISIIIIHNVV